MMLTKNGDYIYANERQTLRLFDDVAPFKNLVYKLQKGIIENFLTFRELSAIRNMTPFPTNNYFSPKIVRGGRRNGCCRLRCRTSTVSDRTFQFVENCSQHINKGSLSNDNGDGNENVISKYKFALF